MDITITNADTQGDNQIDEVRVGVAFADWPAGAPVPSGAGYQAKVIPSPVGSESWLLCWPALVPDPRAVAASVAKVDTEGDAAPEAFYFALPPGVVPVVDHPPLKG